MKHSWLSLAANWRSIKSAWRTQLSHQKESYSIRRLDIKLLFWRRNLRVYDCVTLISPLESTMPPSASLRAAGTNSSSGGRAIRFRRAAPPGSARGSRWWMVQAPPISFFQTWESWAALWAPNFLSDTQRGYRGTSRWLWEVMKTSVLYGNEYSVRTWWLTADF